MTLAEMCAAHVAAKEAEREAIETRRRIEDDILIDLGAMAQRPDKEGTSTVINGDWVIKVTSRMNRKIDAEKLQALAAESGLTDHLSTLFRWKPELVLTAWRSAAPNITAPLAGAITTTPGRPSLSVQPIDDKE